MVSTETNFSRDKQLKFVILGEPACGKTSLVQRYCHDEFSRQYYPTIGVDFFLKRTLVSTNSIRLVIWDVSGGSLASSLLDKYLYESQAIILTFDITNSISFGALPAWYNIVKNYISNLNGPKPQIFVIANKCDVEHQRAVPVEKQNRFLNENRLPIFNVSTRTGENVVSSFQYMIAHILGIKLSKSEVEIQQKEVTAEIFVNRSNRATSYHPPSSICRVQ